MKKLPIIRIANREIMLVLFFTILLTGCLGNDYDHHHNNGDRHEMPTNSNQHNDQSKHFGNQEHSDYEEHFRHSSDEESVNFNNAIKKSNLQKGIMLSPQAEKFLDIKRRSLDYYHLSENRYRIPWEALVRFRNQYEIYVFEDQWYKAIPVELVLRDRLKNLATIKLLGPTKKNYEVIMTNAALLRLAYIEALFSASGDGHGH